jgi:putative transposase
MVHLPRTREGEFTFFVSAQASERERLLQSDRIARLLLQVLFLYRRQGKYLLHEFVVMPNHFHLLISPSVEVTLERALQLIKGRCSFEAGKRFSLKGVLWQRSFHDRRMRDLAEYMQFRKYIYSNPIKAGLVVSPSDYRYSSAYPGFKLDPIPQWLKPRSISASTQG